MVYVFINKVTYKLTVLLAKRREVQVITWPLVLPLSMTHGHTAA